MVKPARLGQRSFFKQARTQTPISRFYLLTDHVRLPDPSALLACLPRNTAIIIRHQDRQMRTTLAQKLIKPAHKLGLKVLIANDMGLALRCGGDGVHLSEHAVRRNRKRIQTQKPGFIRTAAAHSRTALWRAQKASADVALLSPVFPTDSHPQAKTVLGPIRFALLARHSAVPVVALGGITAENARRFKKSPAFGLAAIGGWQD